MSDYTPAINQAKTFGNFLSIGLDVGFDARAAQTIKCRHQLLIATTIGLAIGGFEQIISFEMERTLWCVACIHLGDQLADAVDENVFIVDGCQPSGTGGDGNADIIVMVLADARIGLGRERKDRMLHRPHVIFWDRVRHIADEEIVDWITVGQQRLFSFRVFTHHRSTIVFLHTHVKPFVLSPTSLEIAQTFVLLHTIFRVFTHQLSCFYTPAASIFAQILAQSQSLTQTTGPS